jgi:acetyl-CoA acetyltransferase
MGNMVQVHLSGCGMTRFGKREESLQELFLEAAQNAMKDCEMEDVDAVYVGSMNPDEFCGDSNISTVVSDHLGILKPSMRVETASSTGASVFHAAFMAVASGCHENVLVLAGEKMTHMPAQKATKILAKVISPEERVYGASMPALAALVTRRYMHVHGLDRETLARVAVKNHYNGSLNPYAHFQKEVDLDTVLASRMIANPLRLYDCAPISDGACAAILSARGGDVNVTGMGHATDTLALVHRDSLTGFRSTLVAAKRAYSMTHMKPSDIDVAEVHDAFTMFEIIDCEDLGFFKKGEGGKALRKGVTALEGQLPVNTSGGLKARGHPVGASGLAQIIEIYWQLCGAAGKRQVDGARLGLTQSIGGLANNNLVTIMEACE